MKMRILYVGMKYDYGNPERGYSYEHYNFYNCLVNMGYDVIYFDFLSILKEKGKNRMNELLLKTVKEKRPDVLFSVLFTDEIKKEVIEEITKNTDTITINWFCDDQWRFDNFTKFWAPLFNWSITTTFTSLKKYEEIGYKNVIKSQWACNHFYYKKLNLPCVYNVTFVGNPHSGRRRIIKKLKRSKINIEVWGANWGHGRISQDNMIKIFNQSKINLNFARTSIRNPDRKKFQFWKKKRVYVYQIKGRVFEVPGCGGFLLTEYAEDLSNYYEIDKEIVSFHTFKEMKEKIKYYLKEEKLRREIAVKGYRRTLEEHTYEKRFREIFKKIGME